MMRRIAIAILALAGCRTSPLRPEGTPEGYVAVDRAGFSWRVMSADGVAVGLRTRAHEPQGSLEFWQRVIERELESRGYALERTEPAAAAGGAAGTGMLFAAPGAEPQGYYLALFATLGSIQTFEAGGPRGLVEAALPQLKAWLAALRLGG